MGKFICIEIDSKIQSTLKTNIKVVFILSQEWLWAFNVESRMLVPLWQLFEINSKERGIRVVE